VKKIKIHYGWWIVLFGGILTGFSTTMVNTLNSLYVIPITSEFSFTRSEYIMTSTLTAIAAIFGAPIIGRYMNKNNMKRIQVVLLFIMTLSYISFSIANKLWQFYLASVIIGLIYMSLGMIPISIIITNWFDKKQGFAMSLVLAGISIGGAVLSPITSTLIINYGWKMTRVYIGISYLLISLPIVAFILKPAPEDIGLKPYGWDESNDEVQKKIENKTKVPMEKIKKSTYYKLFLVGVIVSGIICNGGMQHMGPFVTDNHDQVIASLIISLYSFSAIFGKLLLGYLYDRFGNAVSMLFGGGMFTLAYILMAFFPKNLALMTMAAVIYGIGNSVGSVNINLVTYGIFGRENYGKVLSVIKSIQQVGMASGPILFSLLFEVSHDYKLPFTLSIALAILLSYSWIKSYKDAKIESGVS